MDIKEGVQQEQEGNSIISINNIRADSAVMFTNAKDRYKKGIEKRQCKLLDRLDFLPPFLDDDEHVLLVTTGGSPMSIFEQWIGGWVVVYLKRAMFIYTNKRLFHVPTTTSFGYRQSLSSVRYADCESLRFKGRTMVVTYRDGKKEKFYYIARSERKKLKNLFRRAQMPAPEGEFLGRIHQCPRCGGELVKRYFSCPTCGLAFKDRKKASLVSWVYPGGGYFYTGHPIMGVMDALGEIYLSLLVLVGGWMTLQGRQGGLVMMVGLALGLVLEKLVTVYETNHFIDEFIPADKTDVYGGYQLDEVVDCSKLPETADEVLQDDDSEPLSFTKM